MNGKKAEVVRTESNKFHRWIRKALEIWKRASRTVNQDEGAVLQKHPLLSDGQLDGRGHPPMHQGAQSSHQLRWDAKSPESTRHINITQDCKSSVVETVKVQKITLQPDHKKNFSENIFQGA